jgi:transcriptional regulator of acetoin/glycerol metabolism
MLDEIGDMPLEAQAKLLRVLQSKEVIPIGATSPERVDVRVVCATHRDLGRLQREGLFRGDLYARLNEYSLVLPPLRERKEDIYALCRGLLARHGAPGLELTFPFMLGLLHYDYPFNVRELEAFIKRGIALSDGGALDAQHLPDEIKALMKTYGRSAGRDPRAAGPGENVGAPAASPAPQDDVTGPSSSPVVEAGAGARGSRPVPNEEELRALLSRHRGNVAAVGRELGKERMQIHRWMKRFGISPDDYR